MYSGCQRFESTSERLDCASYRHLSFPLSASSGFFMGLRQYLIQALGNCVVLWIHEITIGLKVQSKRIDDFYFNSVLYSTNLSVKASQYP